MVFSPASEGEVKASSALRVCAVAFSVRVSNVTVVFPASPCCGASFNQSGKPDTVQSTSASTESSSLSPAAPPSVTASSDSLI